MDTALKARLIGATVLVALAVLLIPELLSGRKPLDSATAQPEGTRGTPHLHDRARQPVRRSDNDAAGSGAVGGTAARDGP